MIPAFLLCVLVLCIWIHYENKKSSKSEKKDRDSFWQKEHEADFVRKKDISSLDYISIPMEGLPFGLLEQIPENMPLKSPSFPETSSGNSPEDMTVPPEEELPAEKLVSVIKNCEQTIRDLSQKKILNLTGITNTELKLEYGAGNLDELSCYDQNFTLLVRTLHQWGSSLNALGFTKAAQEVLEFGIACGSDVSGSYILLSRIYRKQNNVSGLEHLLAKAQELKTLTKSSIIEKVQTERNYCS